jgi:hypothetical protein
VLARDDNPWPMAPNRMRIRRIGSIVALFLALLPVPTLASPRQAPSQPLSGATRVKSGGSSAATLCSLGESGAPVNTLNIIDFSGSDDAYYTWLNLDSLACPSCGANSYAYMPFAHLALYFPTAPETVTVSATVVSVVPLPCRYPNYMDPHEIMCGPVTAQLDCQDPITVVDFEIPLPAGCVLRQKPLGPGQAFLGFTFLSTTHPDSANRPQLATQAAATLCRSYNTIGIGRYDIVFEYQIGNPIMYANVEACSRLLAVDPGRVQVGPSLQAVMPNPARSTTLVRYSTGDYDDASLQVTDLSGRTVATIPSPSRAPGMHEVRWNLEDATGAHVHAGVYWVVLRAGPHRVARAIAVLP